MQNHIETTLNQNNSGSLNRAEPQPEMDLAFLTRQFEQRKQRKLRRLQQKIQKLNGLQDGE